MNQADRYTYSVIDLKINSKFSSVLSLFSFFYNNKKKMFESDKLMIFSNKEMPGQSVPRPNVNGKIKGTLEAWNPVYDPWN